MRGNVGTRCTVSVFHREGAKDAEKDVDGINRILEGKEGNVIIADRGYVKHGRERIKYIMASVFMDPYVETHDWIYIVSPDDERKFRFASGSQWRHNWFASIPIGIWCQIMNQDEQEQEKREKERVKYG